MKFIRINWINNYTPTPIPHNHMRLLIYPISSKIRQEKLIFLTNSICHTKLGLLRFLGRMTLIFLEFEFIQA